MLKNPVTRIIVVRTAQVSLLSLLAHWLFGWPLMGPSALGLCITPVLCGYFVFVFVGPLTWGLPILSRLPGEDPAVALTFDDGPSLETTGPLLDILGRAGVTATFFVLGQAVEQRPELLRRIIAEGHAVGIHAYRHEPFVLMNTQAIRQEIARTEAAIRRACPKAAIIPWVRPPHGFKSVSLLWTLRRCGYGLAAWSVDSRDYQEGDPGCIAARVGRRAKAGAIILLHDGPGNIATVTALAPLLRELAIRGLVPRCL